MLDRTLLGATRPSTAHRRRHPRPILVLLAVIALLLGGASLGNVLEQPSHVLATSRSGQMTIQDTDSHFVWSSGWSVHRTPSASGGTVHISGKTGATATIVYYGSYLEILGSTGHGAGTVQVTLDGTTTSVSTHGSVFRPRQVIFAAGPPHRRHVLTLRVAGSAMHPFVSIDALVISPFVPAVAPAVEPTTNPTSTPTHAPAATPTPTTAAANPPTMAPGAPSGPGYGSGIGADSLANTQIGGSLCECSNNASSYRFRATTTSKLDTIRIYLIDGSGYAGGTGGTLSITVQTDDGSALHAPSGTVLASTSYKPGNPGPNFPAISWSSPASLTAGQLYHIVFKNIDAHPTANFVSIDSLFSYGATLSPQQPRFADADWGQLMSTTGNGGWERRTNFTPILDLGYSNGVRAGVGYMEVWVGAPRAISGASAVREIFTPAANQTVSSVEIRVSRKSGSSPLGVALETSGGSVLATGSISASSFGSSPTLGEHIALIERDLDRRPRLQPRLHDVIGHGLLRVRDRTWQQLQLPGDRVFQRWLWPIHDRLELVRLRSARWLVEQHEQRPPVLPQMS